MAQKNTRYLCSGKSDMDDVLVSFFLISVSFYSNFNRQTEDIDISSDEEILCDDVESSFESISTDKSTVTITNEIYRRLMKASVDVYKSNEDIKKLNGIISNKDAKIKELQNEISVMKRSVMNMDKLSKVSFQ